MHRGGGGVAVTFKYTEVKQEICTCKNSVVES